MQSDISLSIATTTSGVIGGVTKAISAHLTLCSITMQGVGDVSFYALVSASVGYIVKVAFDSLVRKCKSKNQAQ